MVSQDKLGDIEVGKLRRAVVPESLILELLAGPYPDLCGGEGSRHH
jgi:hypothetical protein